VDGVPVADTEAGPEAGDALEEDEPDGLGEAEVVMPGCVSQYCFWMDIR
jgi:hypothetical protein